MKKYLFPILLGMFGGSFGGFDLQLIGEANAQEARWWLGSWVSGTGGDLLAMEIKSDGTVQIVLTQGGVTVINTSGRYEVRERGLLIPLGDGMQVGVLFDEARGIITKADGTPFARM
jgi:hypothetical protein